MGSDPNTTANETSGKMLALGGKLANSLNGRYS